MSPPLNSPLPMPLSSLLTRTWRLQYDWDRMDSWSRRADKDFQSENILALTNAANVELEPIWASLLAKALEGKNVKDLLSNVGSGGGAPAASAAPAAAAGGAPAAEAPKEEAKPEKEEESDDDMVRRVHFFAV
ncbi:hypothetical protein C0992_003645 [Termitomyces sp. T32_za158]|nr:hypothetical protein C0992_003645 [Termitomyces sp. T32_za158]